MERNGQPDEALRAMTASLESLCRDLLALIRCVRVYPSEHPFLADLAERLVARVGDGLPDPLILGITPSELSMSETFFGGERFARTRELAGYLHARRVLRVVWTGEASVGDVVGFADVVAQPRLQGADLRKALQARDIFTIDAEPLTYERIHDSFKAGSRGDLDAEDADRGRQAWGWLLDDEVAPEKVAELLTSEQFWQRAAGGAEDGAGVDPGDLAAVLVRVGRRLGTALECLPAERRQGVEDRLAKLGRKLSPDELARLLSSAEGEVDLDSPVLDAVEKTLGAERLVEVLAGLVTLEGHDTRRMADIYRRFAPGGRAQELLPVVRARLEAAHRGGLAVEIWSAVEDFLLSLEEDSFMGSEYSGSLDILTEPREASPYGGELRLCESADLECQLDEVLIGAALEEDHPWRARLLDRMALRAEELDLRDFLALVLKVDRELPRLIDSDPDFVEQIFRLGHANPGGPDSVERGLFLDFIVRHESVLLNAVLRALGEEERISSRRFLVEVLCRFSSASTPTLVSRVRSAPWYVARNLVIALGRRGEGVTMPVFRTLLGHEHPKVRREAIIALGRYEAPSAREALQEIATGRRDVEHQQLAERVLQGAHPAEFSI